MRRVTITDVAKLAGVSISTVSRYLNDPSIINPSLAVSVSKAIQELEYVPNPFAQNLKTERTKTIAIIVPNIANIYFSEACKAMCDMFYGAKYLVMMCDCDNDSEKERYYIEEMIRNRVAGLMIASTGGNSEYLQKVIASGEHVVLFDRMEVDVETDTVYEDNMLASYNLTQHMLSQGHKRFVVLNGPDRSVNMRYRLFGVTKALEEAGLTLEEKYVIKNLEGSRAVAEVTEKLLRDKNCPPCIIANNPLLLSGLVYTLNRLGVSVPGDFSPAGFAIKDPRYEYPFPVPAVLQHPSEVGTQAGEMMLKRLRRKSKSFTPKQVMLPTTLIV